MSTGHGIVRLKSLWAPMGPLARTALVAAALAILIVLLSARGLIGALLTPAAGVSEAGADDQKQREELFKKSFEGHLAQINGRSMFFIPPAPRKAEGPKGPDPGPSAPTSYGGPALVGFANGAAYFADGRKLRPDETKEGTLKVKVLNPPWGATVEWEGVEFTISLFDHDRVVIADKKYPALPVVPDPTPAPSPKPDAAASAKPDGQTPEAKPDAGSPAPSPTPTTPPESAAPSRAEGTKPPPPPAPEPK